MVAQCSAKAKQFPQVAVVVSFSAAQIKIGTTTALHQLCSGHGQTETPHPVPVLQENGLPEPSWFKLIHSVRTDGLIACCAARNSTHFQSYHRIVEVGKDL